MTIERLAEPLRIVGGYELHVYCDSELQEYEHEWFASFIGKDKATARRSAKNAGWKLRHDGTATCPDCLRNGRK